MRISIDMASVTTIGKDLQRPEGVVAGPAGELYTADVRGHINVIHPGGGQSAFGSLGGRPNGICLDQHGAVIVANIGNGQLQRVTRDGQHTVIAESASGQPMPSPNFPLVDRRGRIWCSNSSTREDLQAALRQPCPDGCVFRVDNGRAEIVADGLVFANGMALDAGEKHLYVAETLARRIRRFRIRDDGGLDDQGQYGPELGERGQPDGIAFDVAGNLWVTLVWDAAIGVIYPDQTFEVVLRDEAGGVLRRPSNICFGGPENRTAYVGSLDSDTIPCFEAPFAGLPLAGPQ